MNDAHRPFYATLAAICYLTTLAAVLAAYGKLTEAVGVGAAVTGLLALARSPNPTPIQNIERAETVAAPSQQD